MCCLVFDIEVLNNIITWIYQQFQYYWLAHWYTIYGQSILVCVAMWQGDEFIVLILDVYSNALSARFKNKRGMLCMQYARLNWSGSIRFLWQFIATHCGLYLRLLCKVCLYLWDMSIVSIIWNNPTGLQLSLYFRVYNIFRYCSQFLSCYIVLQFLWSTILIITMNGVIWSGHIKQKCQQIADCQLFCDRGSLEGAIKTITGTKNDLVFLYMIFCSIQWQGSHGNWSWYTNKLAFIWILKIIKTCIYA
jgi:hypothetical protein